MFKHPVTGCCNVGARVSLSLLAICCLSVLPLRRERRRRRTLYTCKTSTRASCLSLCFRHLAKLPTSRPCPTLLMEQQNKDFDTGNMDTQSAPVFSRFDRLTLSRPVALSSSIFTVTCSPHPPPLVYAGLLLRM